MNENRRRQLIDQIRLVPVRCTGPNGEEGWKAGPDGEEFYGFQAKMDAKGACRQVGKRAKVDMQVETNLDRERSVRGLKVGRDVQAKATKGPRRA